MIFSKLLFYILLISSSAQAFASDKCQSKYQFSKETSKLPKDINIEKLIGLTQWPNQENLPIYSILVSYQGKIFYEMYTADIKENESHAIYSVTKSVVSLLVGIAKDQGLIKDLNDPITNYLPKEYVTETIKKKFEKITFKNALGMSAINTEEFPIVKSLNAILNSKNFFLNSNRPQFAVSQQPVLLPGIEFNYSENTMSLIGAALQNVTKQSLHQYASTHLFKKLDFKNDKWLFRDSSGYDMAGYGLKIRPIDMHKIGVMILNKGCWNNSQVVSEKWIDEIQTAWIKSAPDKKVSDYGWLWWHYKFPNGWDSLVAHGRSGQNLVIFPNKEIVISMTGHINHDEQKTYVFLKVVKDFIIPAFESSSEKKYNIQQLESALKNVLHSNKNFRALPEPENAPSEN